MENLGDRNESRMSEPSLLLSLLPFTLLHSERANGVCVDGIGESDSEHGLNPSGRHPTTTGTGLLLV